MKFHSATKLRKACPRPLAATQGGIALVITLIMLSVITFMAVTFLVLSQRERGAVSTTTDQAIARMTADAGTDRAKAELLAPMLTFENAQAYGFRVSTNFINARGFDPNAVDPRTNVNFAFRTDGLALTLDQSRQNLANLLYNPRPPVFLTNEFGTNEFRFYLDLNRNGRFDTNGWLPVLDARGQPVVDSTGATNYDWFVGDPEWIGILEYPDRPHGPNNRFVGRYATVSVPASLTLDVNYIHNQAVSRALNSGNDGFFRNQGMGTWEINLAAVWPDLNVNVWPTNSYLYSRALDGTRNQGIAFDDALAFLGYRYDGSYANLARASSLFSNSVALRFDGLDQYSDGPLNTGTGTLDNDVDVLPWPGADNPNHFFSAQDFFSREKLPANPGFVSRLYQASTNSLSSYDQYTYYRLLSQLGTDSMPERGKINVNFRNVDANGVIRPELALRRESWGATEFFTNAADRLLRTNTAIWATENIDTFVGTFGITNAFGLTNIPVYVTNAALGVAFHGYTPSVHRLLQVAANIYDASANRTNVSLGLTAARPLHAPTVFKPVFRRDADNTQVFIIGYIPVPVANAATLPWLMDENPRNVTAASMVDPAIAISRQRIKVSEPGDRITGDAQDQLMVYGIPLVIGAKAGFPSFSKFALQNSVRVTRKLHFQRPPGGRVNQTNQVYTFGISNSFGVQAWNSYEATYPSHLSMRAVADVRVWVTNEFGQVFGGNSLPLSNHYVVTTTRDIPAGTWRGFTPQSVASFMTPILTNQWFLTNSAYVQTDSRGGGTFNVAIGRQWDPENVYRVPKLWLNVHSRVRFALVDTATGRLVDYANLDSREEPLDIMATAARTGQSANLELDPGIFWETNRYRGNTERDITRGILNQINVSAGSPSVTESYWQSFSGTEEKPSEIPKFFRRLYGTTNTAPEDLSFQTPFNPTRTIHQQIAWEVNDPLVHYTVGDLVDLFTRDEPIELDANDRNPVAQLASQNPLSRRYRPWGGNPLIPSETSPPTQWNPGVKDPMVFRSDDWNFPTNTLANVGWLGRVHRGSPWQTVFLKAIEPNTNAWQRWSGNRNIADAIRNRPGSDRLLFDVFTAALNDNATRGQLSVNQRGLAAWSAVLSGVAVTTNALTGEWTLIQPAALSPEVARIVEGINATRASTNIQGAPIFRDAVFARLGDVLATPQLTDHSPFLSTTNMTYAKAAGITDDVYERIPQQILSLLTLDHTPRFIIYSYGQTLRPAPGSALTSGPFYQMRTNYQVTAETVTRTMVRLEGFGGTNSNPRMVIEQFNVLPPD